MAGYTDQYALIDEDQNGQNNVHNSVPASHHGTDLTPQITMELERMESPPAAPPPTSNHSILYIHSARLAALAKRAHVNRDRAILLHALLEATNLLDAMDVEEGRPATVEDLRNYHASTQYLAALANYHLFSPRQLSVYGLEDDCAPYPGMFEQACLSAGGSLQAAAALAEGRYRIALNLEGGGRHHARKAKASGFCYINDVVLAILRLLGRFRRVLYLDIDIHHGDAVEEAFASTDRVLTVSLHHAAAGYYPGTGRLGATGATGFGAGFGLNLPLREGLRDSNFINAFSALLTGSVQIYRPECIVLTCGVDGLAHDPVGKAWSLTPAAYKAAASLAAGCGLPLLVLGGGGYNGPASACAWTATVAGLLGKEVDDVPYHDYFDKYGPSYQIMAPGRPPLSPDSNTAEEVMMHCHGLLRVLVLAVERRSRENASKAVNAGAAQQPQPQQQERKRVKIGHDGSNSNSIESMQNGTS